MKRGVLVLTTLVLFPPHYAFPQLLEVDQRADAYGNGYFSVTTNAPIGQTFTPTNGLIGFVHLFVWDGGPSRLRVNLRQGGINGPVIATSRSTSVAAISQIPVHFDFATNVPVTPGQLHCIEPILESGADCRFVYYHYGYTGGDGIVNGQPSTGIYSDMWFREGSVANFARFISASNAFPTFTAALLGLPGQRLIIESSTNGVTWLPLQTSTFSASVLFFSHSNSLDTQRFYRAFYPVP